MEAHQCHAVLQHPSEIGSYWYLHKAKVTFSYLTAIALSGQNQCRSTNLQSHLTRCLLSLFHTRTNIDIIDQRPGEMDWKYIRFLGLIIAGRFVVNPIPELCNDLHALVELI